MDLVESKNYVGGKSCDDRGTALKNNMMMRTLPSEVKPYHEGGVPVIIESQKGLESVSWQKLQ